MLSAACAHGRSARAAAAKELGLSLQCPELGTILVDAHRASRRRPGVAPKEIRDGIRARGILTAGGLGKYKDSAFRIGHMGDIRVADVDRTLAALAETLAELAAVAMKLQTKILDRTRRWRSRSASPRALPDRRRAARARARARAARHDVHPAAHDDDRAADRRQLVLGVASLGDMRRLGRIGGKTLAWFAGSTLIAATIGLVAALVTQFGNGLDNATRDALTTQFEQHGTAAGQMVSPTLTQTLLAMIPSNPFAAAAQGELLPLIVAVCIFGAAATALQSEGKRTVAEFLRAA